MVILIVELKTTSMKFLLQSKHLIKKKMDGKIIFEKDRSLVKNSKHLQNNVFLLYSPRALNQHFESATYRKINTEVTAFLPENSKGFLTSIFRENKIDELFYGKHRLCLEILKIF